MVGAGKIEANLRLAGREDEDVKGERDRGNAVRTKLCFHCSNLSARSLGRLAGITSVGGSSRGTTTGKGPLGGSVLDLQSTTYSVLMYLCFCSFNP
jgi:hypothetical protein